MEKETFFECVTCCSADGLLRVERTALDVMIAEREYSLLGECGVACYLDRLSLARFCIEQQRDRRAMDICLGIFYGIINDASLRCGGEVRMWLKLMAFDMLKSLCCSSEEVVWEICSQLTSDYQRLYPDW